MSENERADYVPAQWECPKCHFGLTTTTLHVYEDKVTADNTPGHKCPNCNCPLWRVTWKQQAHEMLTRAEEQVERAVAAEAMVATLTAERDALKALCHEVAKLPLGPSGYCSQPLDDLRDRARNQLAPATTTG